MKPNQVSLQQFDVVLFGQRLPCGVQTNHPWQVLHVPARVIGPHHSVGMADEEGAPVQVGLPCTVAVQLFLGNGGPRRTPAKHLGRPRLNPFRQPH